MNIRLIIIAYFVVLFALNYGCTTIDTSNNYLSLRDIVEHLTDNGTTIRSVQPLESDVIKAQKAVAINIAGSEIGVYKFNSDFQNQSERLKRIKKDGYVYIMGLKYPAIVNGTFVIVNVHKNPQKHQILKALKSFQ